jgi:hypothetical protein
MPSVEEAVSDADCGTATNLLFPNAILFQLELTGTVRKVQVIPLVEEAAAVPPVIATNVLFPKDAYRQLVVLPLGNVRNVQVMPSVEEAAVVELFANATNMLFPKDVGNQLALAGNVRNVQVIPSVEEAAEDELYAIATNVFTSCGIIPILNVSATDDVFVILIDLIIVDVAEGTE